MARELTVKIVGDTKDLERALGRAQNKSSGFQRGLSVASKGAAVALGGIGLAATAAFKDLARIETINAQTAAAIKSTGGVANVTSEQIQGLAGSLEDLTGFEAESIQEGQNMLLTFKNIRNEVGKGNDIFNQTTQATLDLSVAMGRDMKDSAIMVGKAMNDPIKGLTAMRRVGIQFTQAQEDQIRAMVESGNIMGAQKEILKELESQFGGSARAAGDTFAGQLNKAKHAAGEMMEGLVVALLPALTSMAGILTRLAGFLQKHTKLVQIAVIVVGGLSVAILALNAGMKVYRAVVLAATAAQWLLNAALTANPIGLVVVGVVALSAALVVAYQKSETFRRVVNASIDWVKRNWDVLLAAIFPLGGLFILLARRSETFRSAAVGAFNAVKGPASTVASLAKDLAHWFSRAVSWVKDLVGWIGKIKMPSLSSLNPFGDGVVGLAANPGGLSPSILDELGLAQSMGLTLTSGYRPGSITSTGNPSLHGIGKAIDVAGPASLMAAYARAVAGRAGVRELIYTPVGAWYPGVGWTRPSGSVAADHYDHVHVGVFDQPGWKKLETGWNMIGNFTGRPEPVWAAGNGGAPGGGTAVHFHGPVYGSPADIARMVKRELDRAEVNGG